MKKTATKTWLLKFRIVQTPKSTPSYGLDDTQLYTGIKSLRPSSLAMVSACEGVVTGWHIRNNLLLNQTKTEAHVTGTRQQVAKLDQSGGIPVFVVDVSIVSKLLVFSVILDCHLSLDDRITSVVQLCHYHVRALRHIRPLFNTATANIIAGSIVRAMLDYCNFVLSGVT